MRRADYLDGLCNAFLGEIAGAASARSFAMHGLASVEREMCGMIERLETMTADILAPLLPSVPDEVEIGRAVARGEDAAARLDGWWALVDHAAHGLDRYVEAFALLRDAAPAADRATLDLLVGHEIALRYFGEAALAGGYDPAESLRAALAAAERHLAACG